MIDDDLEKNMSDKSITNEYNSDSKKKAEAGFNIV